MSTTNYFDMDPLMGRNGKFVALKGAVEDARAEGHGAEAEIRSRQP